MYNLVLGQQVFVVRRKNGVMWVVGAPIKRANADVFTVVMGNGNEISYHVYDFGKSWFLTQGQVDDYFKKVSEKG